MFTLVRQGALLAREVLVVTHFTSLPAVVELNHNDFRRHMATALRRWIDTELLSELSQSYSMVMMVGKRREEFEASTGPMSERPLPIRNDQHDDPKVIGQYRYVEKVNGRSKYMNELNDLGVFMQYDNHKWRMFCAANACYLVHGATGKYERAKRAYIRRGTEGGRPRYTKWHSKGSAMVLAFDDATTSWRLTGSGGVDFCNGC